MVRSSTARKSMSVEMCWAVPRTFDGMASTYASRASCTSATDRMVRDGTGRAASGPMGRGRRERLPTTPSPAPRAQYRTLPIARGRRTPTRLDGWTFYPSNKNRQVVHQDPQLDKPDDQNIRALFANFLDSIKTGRRPVCDIESGHRSTSVSLLGMLSLKLGRSIQWGGEKELIMGDPAANKLLRRPYRSPWEYPA